MFKSERTLSNPRAKRTKNERKKENKNSTLVKKQGSKLLEYILGGQLNRELHAFFIRIL